jgi:hypothetical protein
MGLHRGGNSGLPAIRARLPVGFPLLQEALRLPFCLKVFYARFPLR